MILYVLDDEGRPVREPDAKRWAKWLVSHDRHVADDYVGDVRISTIFYGLDSIFSSHPDAEPLLWETMVFGGEHNGWQDRYTSREDALEGHAAALAMVM